MGVIDPEAGEKSMDGRLYSINEALFSHWDEALEDVEGGRESSEFLVVSFGLTHLLTSS